MLLVQMRVVVTLVTNLIPWYVPRNRPHGFFELDLDFMVTEKYYTSVNVKMFSICVPGVWVTGRDEV